MGYIAVIRPLNCTIAFVSVFVGAWIGTGFIFSPQLLLAGMIAFVICAYGNIINDIYDVEIDRINNPNRPLPSGKVNINVLRLYALFFVVVGTGFSISLGLWPFLVVLAVSAALFGYALFIKKTVFGNILVAVMGGMSFILGGLITSNYACLYPFFFSIPAHISREIVKDVIDSPGDKTFGIVSLPIIIGRDRSLYLSAMCIVVLCVILPIPFILRVLNTSYIFVLLIAAYPLLVYTIVALVRMPDNNSLKLLSRLIKAAMGVGLIAMVI
jgi:geranylgeranylglycerol-phosphate geranylgeranyltransferase